MLSSVPLSRLSMILQRKSACERSEYVYFFCGGVLQHELSSLVVGVYQSERVGREDVEKPFFALIYASTVLW